LGEYRVVLRALGRAKTWENGVGSAQSSVGTGGCQGRIPGRHRITEMSLGGDRVGLEALGRARVKKEYQGAATRLTVLICHDAGCGVRM